MTVLADSQGPGREKPAATAAATGPSEMVSLPSDALILLPVRQMVLFPGLIAPFAIGRPKSIAAVQEAVKQQRPVGVVMQRDPEIEDPGPEALYRMGTVANILRYMTAPDGTHHVVCQGVQRMRIQDFLPGTPFPVARVLYIAEPDARTPDIEARFINLQRQALEAVQLLPQAPQELIAAIQAADSPGALADLAAGYLDVKPEDKQAILETVDLAPRLDRVSRLLAERIEVLRLTNEIGRQTKATFDERQREAILREQMATIQRQLGEGDNRSQEIAELNEAIAKAKMPPEVEAQARKELRRYERMPEAAAEAGMVRTYLDWLVELPWSLPDEAPIDIAKARRILDEDHYGLDKVKTRIIEYLAVRKLAPHGKAPILCFVGPPGVGKTSLGQSIARAMARPFGRVSLGGVHDEAEIRGHRRTYIGALPGNIIQAIKKAGARNCVMMLDEIDKMGRGFQGDPSAAMLEVLDPEQNAHLPRQLPRRAVRSVARGLHHHGQHARHHPGAVARSHGDHQPRRLYREREAGNRQALSHAPAARSQWPERRAGGDRRGRLAPDHPRLHAGGGRAQPRAGDRQGVAARRHAHCGRQRRA